MPVSDEYYSFYDLSESEVVELLQDGPLNIALSADNWEYYGSGVFSCPSWAGVNHAVLLVGYTEEYWIVKNEWGSDWGEDGYIRIAKGVGSTERCFVGQNVLYFERDVCELQGCRSCNETNCLVCRDSSAILADG